MQLTSAQVKRTQNQFDAEVIPANHPAMPQLTQLFGAHTFFLDRNGLNILEPAESGEVPGTQICKVVYLAKWNNADPPSLEAHEPTPTDVTIEVESVH